MTTEERLAILEASARKQRAALRFLLKRLKYQGDLKPGDDDYQELCALLDDIHQSV